MDSFDWGETLPTLEAERLTLRMLALEHAPALLRVFGDPVVMRYWGSPPFEDLAAATERIEEIHRRFAQRDLFQWGIFPKDAEEPIGTCTIFKLDRYHRRAELGIALGRDSWGQGLATEAMETLIGFAFETLDLHRLEADIDPKNEASLKLFERQGFQREGFLRERWFQWGRFENTLMLGLLRREWVGRSPSDPATPSTSPRGRPR